MAGAEETDARFDRLESKVETLARTVHDGFARVDERFSQVDERFSQVDERLSQVDERLSQVDERLSQIDDRFPGLAKAADVDVAFEEQRRYIELAFNTLRTEMNAGFSRLERKFDWLVERLSNRS